MTCLRGATNTWNIRQAVFPVGLTCKCASLYITWYWVITLVVGLRKLPRRNSNESRWNIGFVRWRLEAENLLIDARRLHLRAWAFDARLYDAIFGVGYSKPMQEIWCNVFHSNTRHSEGFICVSGLASVAIRFCVYLVSPWSDSKHDSKSVHSVIWHIVCCV